MKNLYQTGAAAELKERVHRLRPDSPRQWGKMSAPQAVAHLAKGMQLALGEFRPPRVMIGRVIGRVIKPLALGNDEPMRKNSPTVPGMIPADDPDFESERERLCALIDRFVAVGPAGCTTHPHSFFGKMTPDEWSILMYKHLDHHLRQFGA